VSTVVVGLMSVLTFCQFAMSAHVQVTVLDKSKMDWQDFREDRHRGARGAGGTHVSSPHCDDVHISQLRHDPASFT